MSSQELKKLEPEILSVVTLETGEPGYDKHARELRGVVATGTTADGSAVAFAAFTGRQISNDHYATHEVFVTRSPTQALDVRNYYSDIAGAEFMSARVVTFAALPFAIGVMPFIIVAGAIIRGSLRFIRSGRSRCSPANGPRSSRR